MNPVYSGNHIDMRHQTRNSIAQSVSHSLISNLHEMSGCNKSQLPATKGCNCVARCQPSDLSEVRWSIAYAQESRARDVIPKTIKFFVPPQDLRKSKYMLETTNPLAIYKKRDCRMRVLEIAEKSSLSA